MAIEQKLQTLTFPAHADLSAKQYYAVSFLSTGDVDVATAGKACTGILQDKPTAAGRAASVAQSGISKVALSASADVEVGTLLEVDTGGTLIPHSSGTVVAQSMEDSPAVATIAIVSAILLPSNAALS